MVAAVGRALGEYARQIRDTGRNSKLYLSGLFLFGVGQAMFMLIFNLYLRSLGFADSGIGQILSKVSLGAAVAAIPAAFLFRGISTRTLLVAAGALAAVGCVFQATLTSPGLLLMVAFLSGMVITVFRLSIAPVVMREADSGARPFLFSASFGIFFLSAIVGSVAGGGLPQLFRLVTDADQLSLRWTLFAASGITLLAVVPFFAMRESAEPGSPRATPGPMEQIRDFLEIDWGLHFKLILPSALIGLGAGLIIPFLNLFFRDRFGLSESQIGILFGVMQGFMVVGNLFGPAVSRRLGLVRGVVVTQLASVPFMVLIALAPFFPVVAAAFFLRGGLMNMNQPLASHFAMEVVPERDHAVTNSLLALAWFVAWSVSADIGGALIERHGYNPPLLLAAGLYVAASILFWGFFKNVSEARVPRAEVEIPDA